ncbi:MAG: tRNA 2-thiouridine(34) synthase MnmA [Bdellovibrionia bacterium]
MIPPKEKVLVAMSGGINSCTTAVILKTQGYDVVGVFFQFRGPTTEKFASRCCKTAEQLGKGRLKAICKEIGITLHVIKAESLFEDKVVDYTVHECIQNHIPNPCAPCNSEVKFELLVKKADELGCQWIATGHFARVSIDSGSGTAHLLKALDLQKDDTYFLFSLSQAVIQRLLLPLGNLTGQMVEKVADRFNFRIEPKANVPGICFIDEPGFNDFIESRVPDAMRRPGTVRNLDTMVVGEHSGLYKYRLGQPSVVPNPNRDNPYFVVGFDLTSQSMIEGKNSVLIQKELKAKEVNWIGPMDRLHGFHCIAKLEPVHEGYPCQVTCFENQRVHVEFDEPLRAISPGRAIVFYKEDEALGGGIVEVFGTIESLGSR